MTDVSYGPRKGESCMRAINRLVFINLFIYEAVFQQSFEKLDFKWDFPFGKSKTRDRFQQKPEDAFKTFFPKIIQC